MKCTQIHETCTWTGVLVASDSTGFQNLLSPPTIASFVTQVQQDQVVVRAAWSKTWSDLGRVDVLIKHLHVHTIKMYYSINCPDYEEKPLLANTLHDCKY